MPNEFAPLPRSKKCLFEFVIHTSAEGGQCLQDARLAGIIWPYEGMNRRQLEIEISKRFEILNAKAIDHRRNRIGRNRFVRRLSIIADASPRMPSWLGLNASFYATAAAAPISSS